MKKSLIVTENIRVAEAVKLALMQDFKDTHYTIKTRRDTLIGLRFDYIYLQSSIYRNEEAYKFYSSFLYKEFWSKNNQHVIEI